jgi:signal transduction histidine kinase
MDQLQGRLEEIESLAQQVLALQERNQQRMAMDLHDQVLQDLFTARHWLEQAQEVFFSKQAAEAHEVLLKIAAYLRGLLFELRPPTWEHSKLQEVLEDYALAFEEK